MAENDRDPRIWVPPGGSADPRGGPQEREPDTGARPADEAGAEAREPTVEELLEGLRRLQVAEVLLSTAATLAQVAYAKLDDQIRDLSQARLAIDAIAALVPVLEQAQPEAARDLRQAVTNLQLAYASAASPAAPAAEPDRAGDERPPGAATEPPGEPEE